MIWVLDERLQNDKLVWFSMTQEVGDYEQGAYVPCTFYDDTQNMTPLYVRYIARSELIIGPYRYYKDFYAFRENVEYEFQENI